MFKFSKIFFVGLVLFLNMSLLSASDAAIASRAAADARPTGGITDALGLTGENLRKLDQSMAQNLGLSKKIGNAYDWVMGNTSVVPVPQVAAPAPAVSVPAPAPTIAAPVASVPAPAPAPAISAPAVSAPVVPVAPVATVASVPAPAPVTIAAPSSIGGVSGSSILSASSAGLGDLEVGKFAKIAGNAASSSAQKAPMSQTTNGGALGDFLSKAWSSWKVKSGIGALVVGVAAYLYYQYTQRESNCRKYLNNLFDDAARVSMITILNFNTPANVKAMSDEEVQTRLNNFVAAENVKLTTRDYLGTPVTNSGESIFWLKSNKVIGELRDKILSCMDLLIVGVKEDIYRSLLGIMSPADANIQNALILKKDRQKLLQYIRDRAHIPSVSLDDLSVANNAAMMRAFGGEDYEAFVNGMIALGILNALQTKIEAKLGIMANKSTTESSAAAIAAASGRASSQGRAGAAGGLGSSGRPYSPGPAGGAGWSRRTGSGDSFGGL